MTSAYLDHNATSPMLAEVRDAMLEWLGVPANPASVHRFGQRAVSATERAREKVAALCGADPSGVVFTSGATEANHTYLHALPRLTERRVVAHAAIEHPCVLAAIDALVEEQGFERHLLSVDRDGVVQLPETLEGVASLSLMAVNHETGVIQPLDMARERVQRAGCRLHVDATQAAGRVPLTMSGTDALVLSSHKIGGPAGVGALVLADGEGFPALLSGGAQERGRRAGTVNVAGVVGFGVACALAARDQRMRTERLTALQLRVEHTVRAHGGRVVGCDAPRVGNTIAAVFDGVRGETLVQALDLRGVAVSSGAACASGSMEPSPVLTAMGDPSPDGIVRVSLGTQTTEADVEFFAEMLAQCLEGLRLADDWD